MSALPPPLTELTEILGAELDGPEATRAERALANATTLALAEVRSHLAELWSAGTAPAVVRLVIVNAARRGFENPRGINQETLGAHTIGLGSSEVTGVYLTSREVALIRRAAGLHRVGTIRTPSAYTVGTEEGF